MPRRNVMIAVSVLAAIAVVLAGCGATPTPTATPTKAPAPTQPAAPTKPAATTAPTQVPPTAAPTKPPATATPVPPTPTTGPTVGGKFVYALSGEPDTLDHHKSAMSLMSAVTYHLNGALVTRDPVNGKIIPYLADSWTVSTDGLTLQFKLRSGVKFHDGSPLTAKDWAWTLNRSIDPATKSPGTGQFLAALKVAEAVDDATLKLTLKEASFPFLVNLTLNSYSGPLSQAYVEKMGDKYGRNPMGVGPFKFKEWVTGSKIVLERYPDYNWPPAFLHKGPAYLQTVEMLFMPEYSTVVAGLESGDIDLYTAVLAKDVQRLKDTKIINILEYTIQGMNPYIGWNNSKWPFDDVKVRKALNYATDRSVMIKTVALGQAVPQHGPVSASQSGYDPVMETYGYEYDLAKAKALLAEAGWKAGPDGILVKDGKPFKVTMMVLPDEAHLKVAQIAQEQWKAVGASFEIAQTEQATLVNRAIAGDFELLIIGYGWPEADILVLVFGSNKIGGMGLVSANDDELDRLLMLTRTTVDPAQRQQAVNNVAKYAMDNAYVLPLYAPKGFYGQSSRVRGINFSPTTLIVWFNDAYIQK